METSEHISTLAYSRCKACNTRFYPSLDRNTNTYEELCPYCLSSAMMTSRMDPMVYHAKVKNSFTNWSSNDDQRFLDSLFEDQLSAADDDLSAEDEYLKYGENAMGDLKLFDRY